MTITILNKKKINDGSYGVMHYKSRKRMEITISMSKNQTVAEYGATLLHELLHAWVEILKMQGAKLRQRKEHAFIYAVETEIVRLMKKHMGSYND